jgi:hypothetical protein
MKRLVDRGRPPMLGLHRALRRMREPGCLLMQVNGHGRLEYWVTPGGRVSDHTALTIIAQPDVSPCDPGLFSGCTQSWQRRAEL